MSARTKKKYHTKARRLIKTRRRIFAALFFLFAAVGIVAAVNLITTQSGYAASQKKYDALRQYAPPINDVSPESAVPASNEPETPQNLSAINPDYTGWIRIDGTGIDYPVARGEDNEKYLSTTFMGESNQSGAIFMDSRCAEGFDGFAILYGHNMKDGTMFAGLNRYLEPGYREEHPDITIVLPDGQTLAYRIFAVRETDIRDPAYRWEFEDDAAFAAFAAGLGAPEGTGRLLTLSTCTSDGGNDERLLVHAAPCD